MTNRRSIASAIIPPEKMLFIKGADATSVPQPTPTKTIELSIEPHVDSKEAERKPRQPKRTAREDTAPEAVDVLDEILVSRTQRFQYKTAQALTRAHLERKLKRLKPTTQQEIVEIAVQVWLKEHGYLV